MFNISVQQDELMSSLECLKNTISKSKKKEENNAFDIYIKMNIENNELVLTGTNTSELSIAKCHLVSNNGTDNVNLLIPYNTLYTLIETLDKSVVIDISNINNNTVSINYPNRMEPINISALDSSQFIVQQPVENINSKCVVKYNDFIAAIESVGTIIGEEANNPVFNCIDIHIANSRIVVKGMDGYKTSRMALYCKPISHNNDIHFFVNNAAIRKVLAVLDSNQDIELDLTDNFLIIKQAKEQHYIRLSNGAYPEIEKYMPDQYPTVYEINKDDLLKALYRIKAISKGTKTSAFTFKKQSVLITVNSTRGNNTETLSCVSAGNGIPTIAFDTQILIDSLKLIQTDTVRFCFYAINNCVLMPKAKQGYLYRILVRTMALKTVTP